MAHLHGKEQKSILKREAVARATGKWSPWQTVSKEDRDKFLGTKTGWVHDTRAAYRNNIFSVLERLDSSGVIHAAIASLSGIRPTFYEMQRIKDELFGTDSVGIEIYPAAKDVIDGSDMFHLWILPGEIPFGLKKVDASKGATTPAGQLLLGSGKDQPQ